MVKNLPMKLILCSNSPRRKQLIKKLQMPYIIYPVDVNENIKTRTPVELVTKLALLKSTHGAMHFSSGITIGADTIVVANDNKIIGKPKNHDDAFRILKKLSGTAHTVYTGIALINCATGSALVDFETTKVRMRKLADSEIKNISKKHLDKAGAYAVQEKDDNVIEKIYGDYYNVVGFPIKKIKSMLRKMK